MDVRTTISNENGRVDAVEVATGEMLQKADCHKKRLQTGQLAVHNYNERL